jgi:HSP20 family protein
MTVGLTRWTPANDLFRARFGRFFDQIFEDALTPGLGQEPGRSNAWVPAVDIKETAGSLILTAELPGLKKEDVQLSIENHVLTLSGERRFEKDVEEENYHRVERTYGSFTRSFTLPDNVRTEEVDASFEHGVLTIQLPKTEEAKPRKIAIR